MSIQRVLNFYKPEHHEEVRKTLSLISKLHSIGTDTIQRHTCEYLQRCKASEEQETDNILEFYASFKRGGIALRNVNDIYIFGAGGTTSWFLPKLLKVCNHYPDKVFNIILMDGDVVETKNILRQNFIHEDVDKNKAEVLIERYSGIYSNVNLSHIPKYVTWSRYDKELNIERSSSEESKYFDLENLDMKENSIVVSLVDNEAFKIKLDLWSMTKQSVLFNAGININNGQVFADGSYYIPRYILNHIELVADKEELDLKPSCADVINTKEPDQRYVGNDLAATLLASKVQEHFERNFWSTTYHRFESFTLRPKVTLAASKPLNTSFR